MPQYQKFVAIIIFWLLLLLMLLSILFSVAYAQNTTENIDSGLKLADIQVLGTSDTIASLVEINLNARANTPINTIDLQAERNRVLAMGSFAEVSLHIEDRTEGPVLIVRVKENPLIGEIAILGTSQNTEELLAVLAEVNLLKAGGLYNTVRAKEAIKTLQRAYQQLGWPFDIPVSLRSEPLENEDSNVKGLVKLTYSITEELLLKRVVFEGNTVFTDNQLLRSFKDLEDAGVFDFNLYIAARQAVSEQYRELGYFGSGVDNFRSNLSEGIFTVQIRELIIASIDATAVGIDPSKLSLSSGELFNYDTLLEDVKKLSKGRTSDISLGYASTSEGEVRVRLAVGPPASAGKISTVEIRGNTAILTEALTPLLQLKAGDTFTSALAQDDFRRIQEFYSKNGFAIVPEADFNYEQGKYIQKITELKITAYDIIFDDEETRTAARVITRYLPDEGSIYSQNALRSGLLNASRLGIVEPLDVQLRFPNEKNLSEALVRIAVAERPTRNFSPSLNYTTEQGLSTQVTYSDSNFLGLAHNFSVSLSGFSADNGLLIGGEVGYKVPWLDIDLLDFAEVPTSFGVSIFSNASGNQTLLNGNEKTTYHPCITYTTNPCPKTDDNKVNIGEYDRRSTGFSLSLGRPVFDFTNISFSVGGSYNNYRLEPTSKKCTFDEDGNVEDKECALAKDTKPQIESEKSKCKDAKNCYTVPAEVLPNDGLSGFVGSGITFDNRDRIEFPSEGFKVSVNGGLGFGNDFTDNTSYLYEQLEFGARAYLALAEKNHVLAFRVNAGHQFGSGYPSSKHFSVGDSSNEVTQIRGYTREDFTTSKTYAISSLEYRYNFGLGTAVTQTVIGILFVEAGYVSDPLKLGDDEVPIFPSAGVGLQINIGFGGGILAPIRLDYGFSPRHQTGHLNFRIGFVY